MLWWVGSEPPPAMVAARTRGEGVRGEEEGEEAVNCDVRRVCCGGCLSHHRSEGERVRGRRRKGEGEREPACCCCVLLRS